MTITTPMNTTVLPLIFHTLLWDTIRRDRSGLTGEQGNISTRSVTMQHQPHPTLSLYLNPHFTGSEIKSLSQVEPIMDTCDRRQ